MSDRILLALTVAMRTSTLSSFWIGSFCIPTTQPQKFRTLESMGFIYHIATEVIALLSADLSRALKHQMLRSIELRTSARTRNGTNGSKAYGRTRKLSTAYIFALPAATRPA